MSPRRPSGSDKGKKTKPRRQPPRYIIRFLAKYHRVRPFRHHHLLGYPYHTLLRKNFQLDSHMSDLSKGPVLMCQSIMMMLIRKTSLGHSVGLTLSVEKIKEDFMALENLAKVTLLEEVSTNNKHLLSAVLRRP
ncbi:hypothetical protein DEO72_LG8g1441 [Vigna unguiculata]|uniref:Uncharacterized protein n=1 Tax=Vigna unguiculata TaxID=3917 RepID=A0A4D6MU58_VIGUN|nr:hypothetical protein DEO72_LG8g1441 [Vigna unguiculata]